MLGLVSTSDERLLLHDVIVNSGQIVSVLDVTVVAEEMDHILSVDCGANFFFAFANTPLHLS